MTIATLNFPNNPVLLHFREELHKNPATFERTRNLYYVAALVSSVAAVVFFISAIALQTTILPFWAAIGGATVTIYAGHAFVGLGGKMIQKAKEADKAAVCLKKMQATYKSCQHPFYQAWKEHPFSEPGKIMLTHCLFSQKKHIEARQHLQKLTPESKLKKFIQLQHQELLLKIDLSFKIATCTAIYTGNLNCLIKKEDLLTISKQDPWERYQIQELNMGVENNFIKPLITFKKSLVFSERQELFYERVQEMPPESLATYMFILMNAPFTVST